MTLPKNRGDREYQKFAEDLHGNVCVRVAPGAITDTDGNEMEIDDSGRAFVSDSKVNDTLKVMNANLEKILFQLELINGA